MEVGNTLQEVPAQDANKVASKVVSRRDFLRLVTTGAIATGIQISPLGKEINAFLDKNSKEDAIGSDTIDGVEVFGLKGNGIGSDYELYLLRDKINADFASKLPDYLKQDDTSKQKEFVFGNDVRTCEIRIHKNEYDTISKQLEKDGISFPAWMKMHIDLMNRNLSNTDNANEKISLNLLRIIVADDQVNNYINGVTLPDVDGVYSIEKGYRIFDPVTKSNGGFFWTFNHLDNDSLLCTTPDADEVPNSKKFVLPSADDSLTAVRDGALLDLGICEEIYHRCLNVPDEYVYNLSVDSPFKFSYIQDIGGLDKPQLSPWYRAQIKYNLETKQRGFLDGTLGFQHLEVENAFKSPQNFIPQEIELETSSSEKLTVNLSTIVPNGEIKTPRSWMVYYHPVVFNPEDVYSSDSGSVKIDVKNLIKNFEDIPYVSKIMVIQSGNREVNFPSSILTISALAGVEKPTYNIVFLDEAPTDKYQQQSMEYVKREVLGERITEIRRSADTVPYATMSIQGTDYCCLWKIV